MRNKFFNRNFLVLVKAKGTAIPIQNKNDGNIKSANVKPFHAGCYNHHGPYCKSSTISMPTINETKYTCHGQST